MKYLAIKAYWRHQHYHKRGAPWIKLYTGVLSDAAFIQMPEVAQAQLMKLWVLAATFGHPLPNNPKLIAGKIGTTGKFYLAHFIDAGFVVPCDTLEDADVISRARTQPPTRNGDTQDDVHNAGEDVASDVTPVPASTDASNALAKKSANLSTLSTEERGERREKEKRSRATTRSKAKPSDAGASAAVSTGVVNAGNPTAGTERDTSPLQPVNPAPKGLGVFPKATCDTLYERWVKLIGAVDYGRFRKALLPVFRVEPERYTIHALIGAIEAFADGAGGDDPKFRGKWTPEKFAAELHTWARLGLMDLVDDYGLPTERGRASGIFAA